MRLSLLAAVGSLLLLPQPAFAQPSDGGVRTFPLTAGQRGPAERDTAPFSLVGVSWDDPGTVFEGSVQVRVRPVGGVWGDWHLLEVEADDRPDPGGAERAGRGATAPLWVGPSDGVAVRFTGTPPRGLRAELVDPGRSSARSLPATAHEGPRPGIVTRSGWGADESLREPGFGYTGPVRAVFVHHTDTANDYACSDAPKVIRAIYQYHVKSSGWRDIGYNFLVDRCGTVYEGRAGGVAEPVLGAHTLGFNTDTAGVAALGRYSSDTAPQAQVDGIAKVAAWKLGLTGRDADGSVTLTSASDGSKFKKGTSATFRTVSGHRDAFNTECPGNALYQRLPAIRSWSAHLQGR
ncbi:peptidoglycan recognition protein [Kitasatospora sp. NPDC101801]|uniref:peptidoglycan recognition protein family protein n=1 Tax=Kitasatospora sp. NPDC101801 TaxID=3364103 RepID=UPI00382902DD